MSPATVAQPAAAELPPDNGLARLLPIFMRAANVHLGGITRLEGWATTLGYGRAERTEEQVVLTLLRMKRQVRQARFSVFEHTRLSKEVVGPALQTLSNVASVNNLNGAWEDVRAQLAGSVLQIAQLVADSLPPSESDARDELRQLADELDRLDAESSTATGLPDALQKKLRRLIWRLRDAIIEYEAGGPEGLWEAIGEVRSDLIRYADIFAPHQNHPVMKRFARALALSTFIFGASTQIPHLIKANQETGVLTAEVLMDFQRFISGEVAGADEHDPARAQRDK